MRGKRIVTTAAVALAAASLALTGCGGGSSSDNTALVDELMQEIGNDGIDDASRTCIRDALMGYSTEELESLKSDQEPSVELQDKVVNMMMTCIGDTN